MKNNYLYGFQCKSLSPIVIKRLTEGKIINISILKPLPKLMDNFKKLCLMQSRNSLEEVIYQIYLTLITKPRRKEIILNKTSVKKIKIRTPKENRKIIMVDGEIKCRYKTAIGGIAINLVSEHEVLFNFELNFESSKRKGYVFLFS